MTRHNFQIQKNLKLWFFSRLLIETYNAYEVVVLVRRIDSYLKNFRGLLQGSYNAQFNRVNLFNFSVSELLVVRDEVIHFFVFLVDDFIALLLNFLVSTTWQLGIDLTNFLLLVIDITLDFLGSLFSLW